MFDANHDGIHVYALHHLYEVRCWSFQRLVKAKLEYMMEMERRPHKVPAALMKDNKEKDERKDERKQDCPPSATPPSATFSQGVAWMLANPGTLVPVPHIGDDAELDKDIRKHVRSKYLRHRVLEASVAAHIIPGCCEICGRYRLRQQPLLQAATKPLVRTHPTMFFCRMCNPTPILDRVYAEPWDAQKKQGDEQKQSDGQCDDGQDDEQKRHDGTAPRERVVDVQESARISRAVAHAVCNVLHVMRKPMQQPPFENLLRRNRQTSRPWLTIDQAALQALLDA